MKTNLRKLQLLFALTALKPEMFYAIRVYEDNISLQGYIPNSRDIKLLTKMFGKPELTEDLFIELERNNIKITLTPKY